MTCRKCNTGIMIMGLNALDWKHCQICGHTIPAKETMIVKPKKLSRRTKPGNRLIIGGHIAEVIAVDFRRKQFEIMFFDFNKL